ncbi:MAG: hypothetical protein PHQ34_09300, partial [Methanothrix sp.]|nr:hypothetical protein [Methanothrix sp.]
MNNRMLKAILFAVVFCTAFIFVGFGSEDKVASSLSSPITVNLSISKMPLINETINLYCRVIASSDAPNTTAEITLSEGVELVSGHLTGRLDLKADVPVYLNATIKFSKTGDFKIKAIARHVIDENNSWGDIANVFLTVLGKNSFFTPAPIWAYNPVMQISPGQAQSVENIHEIIPINPYNLPSSNKLPITSKNLSAINSIQSTEFINKSIKGDLSGPTSSGVLTVTGHFSYWGQDSVYKTTPNAWLPAKRFLTGIVRASDNAFLGMGYTDDNGAYSITITNPGSAGFRVSWWTYTQYENGEEMRVIKNSTFTGLTGLTGVYGWRSGIYTSGDGIFDLGGLGPYQTDIESRACWLLNDLQRANRYFSQYSGGSASQATIAWWPTNSLDGCHYHPGGQIHLLADYEGASHVVIHEYGHNLMWTLYGGYFPPTDYSDHTWSRCYDDGLGWIEGWGDFFCCVPDNDPIYKDPSFSVDFESATDSEGYSWCEGPRCEGRVCGALWDIFDTANDGLDTYCWGFGPIANVFIGDTQNTFADFWTQWRSKGYSTDASYCLLQNTIDPGIDTPTVTNDGPASGIGASVATVGAQITSTGGANPHLYIGWGTSNGGTGSWQHTADLGVHDTGTYYADLSPLTPGTTYYYRAYAVNSAGTGWASSYSLFTTISAASNSVALQAANGQFVCAEGGGGGAVVANRNAIGTWETFKLVDRGNGNYALQAANGQYLCAEGSGGGAVVANRNAIGAWETFKLVDRGNSNYALQAANGQYLCAEGSGGGAVVANRNAIGAWETFRFLDPQRPAKVALQAANGQHLCAEGSGGGAVVANRNAIGAWETFKLVDRGK